MIHPRLKQWARPLLHTPLHPQWLVNILARRRKLQLAPLMKGRLLDVGCGDNPLLEWLPGGASYVGLDYPPTIGKGYRGRADVLADAQSLPFADESFDVVVAFDLLEHVQVPLQAVCEMRRALKHGGVLLVQVPFLYPLHDLPDDHQRWTEPGLRQLAGRAGLQVTSLQHHGHPLECCATLANIALVKCSLDAVTLWKPGMLLLPIAAVLVPIINLLGWLGARLLPDDGFMPLGYTAVLSRERADGSP